MKLINIFSLVFFAFGWTTVNAQTKYTITGKVIDSRGAKLSAATVFLDGSQKKTITDNNGAFEFSGVNSGTYRLIVHFVGFKPGIQTAIVQGESATVDIAMEQAPIALKEVVIGNNNLREKFMKIFIENFLGESKNGKACKILNPEIIDFSTNKSFIEANAEDFLTIENPNLGYRIKYLLRNFKFNNATSTASYDGECIFENLEGSDAQAAIWKENRKIAYEGSFMHYLRSLFRNKSREEGFLTYLVKGQGKPPLPIDPRPLTANQITKHVDSTFMVFKFPGRIYTVFDRQKAISEDKHLKSESINQYMDKTGSLLMLYVDQAVVDLKGSYVDYKSFFIQGYWGTKRIGDQLPFEYELPID